MGGSCKKANGAGGAISLQKRSYDRYLNSFSPGRQHTAGSMKTEIRKVSAGKISLFLYLVYA